MFKGIDFFSDTVTRPTKQMKLAMLEAELGDEQKGEDPTTLRLEEKLAELTGKTAAMFFPSATMANEVAISMHCERGEELIADEHCHLFLAEGGGPAVHSGVQTKIITTKHGIFSGEDIRKAYRWPKGPHYPLSKMVSVENTTNMGGGIPWTLSELDSVFEATGELNLKTHMDGARMFHASVALNLQVDRITSRFDSITVCFSKGLACPTGAVLCFEKEQQTKVRRLKQLFGGCMRQSGILAAACLYALDHHVDRLELDHQHAAILASGLREIPNIEVEEQERSTNMVFFHWKSKEVSPEQFLQSCIREGIRFSHVAETRFRAVTHIDITRKDIDTALNALRKIALQ